MSNEQKGQDWDKRIEQGLWRSKDQTIYKLYEMTELHIQKCISMMKKKLEMRDMIQALVKVTEQLTGGKHPEVEEMNIDQAINRVERQLKAFEEELERRKEMY